MTTIKESQLTTKVDADVRDTAKIVLKTNGLTVKAAVSHLLAGVAATDGIPFQNLPRPETARHRSHGANAALPRHR